MSTFTNLQKMQISQYVLEDIQAELDALAALKGFRLQRMRALVGMGLRALAVTPAESKNP